jgi:hypothetical protein
MFEYFANRSVVDCVIKADVSLYNSSDYDNYQVLDSTVGKTTPVLLLLLTVVVFVFFQREI